MANFEDLQKILTAWYEYKYADPLEQKQREDFYENLLREIVRKEPLLTVEALKHALIDKKKAYVRERRKKEGIPPHVENDL